MPFNAIILAWGRVLSEVVLSVPAYKGLDSEKYLTLIH